MARRVHHSRGFGQGSQRRLTSWALGPGGDDLPTLDAIIVSASSSVIYGTGITPTAAPVTIVRTRGFVNVTQLTATAVGDGYQWAFGIGIVSADAGGVGITAVPKPFDDIDWPGWLWHQMGTQKESIGGGADHVQVVNIDSKAMRKIGLNEVAFLVMQFGEVGTSTIEVTAATRMLVKLP